MPRRISARLGLLLAVLVFVVAVPGSAGATPAPPPGAAGGASSVAPDPSWREPDLRMASLRDFRISFSGGRKLLRFTAMLINVGEGHFEVHGWRATRSESTMRTAQGMYTDRGSRVWLRRPPTAAMRYSGDGHDHWHVIRIVLTEVRPIGALDSAPARSAKTGFCFFDTDPYRPSLPRAPASPRYSGASCGTRASLKVHMGLSVGWGDRYSWNLPYQWVDVTGLPDGDYRVCSTADPQGWYVETNDANNRTFADIRISGSSVTLLGLGWWACNNPKPGV